MTPPTSATVAKAVSQSASASFCANQMCTRSSASLARRLMPYDPVRLTHHHNSYQRRAAVTPGARPAKSRIDPLPQSPLVILPDLERVATRSLLPLARSSTLHRGFYPGRVRERSRLVARAERFYHSLLRCASRQAASGEIRPSLERGRSPRRTRVS